MQGAQAALHTCSWSCLRKLPVGQRRVCTVAAGREEEARTSVSFRPAALFPSLLPMIKDLQHQPERPQTPSGLRIVPLPSRRLASSSSLRRLPLRPFRRWDATSRHALHASLPRLSSYACLVDAARTAASQRQRRSWPPSSLPAPSSTTNTAIAARSITTAGLPKWLPSRDDLDDGVEGEAQPAGYGSRSGSVGDGVAEQ